MSAEAPALVREFPVGKFTARLSVQRPKKGVMTSCVIEWTPHIPQRLSAAEIEQYRAGRDAALSELGVTTLVVEV